MYRRYDTDKINYKSQSKNVPHEKKNYYKASSHENVKKECDEKAKKDTKRESKKENPLLKFIPQSIYNPETGKVLGFLSADDLLIVAIILLLIDNDNDGENKMLIYALIYILLADYIELPFEI